jgi:hypothetical protein
VVVNDRTRVMGGPVVWPFGIDVRRSYIDGQEADAEPLRPGQSREVLIVSADSRELLVAVRDATAPVTWHVHLRRGVTRLRWEDVSVGAVVGVEFDPTAVKRMDEDG